MISSHKNNPLFAIVLSAMIFFIIASAASAKDHEYDPNTYTWQPELSPHGPVLISVSLRTQTAAVYRNGVKIGSCRVSTGRPGFKTPTGIFHILNKDAHHRSKKYNNAPMPYSEQITKEGVALHAGYIPTNTGTSSHGCIHLPYNFAKKLFGITDNGVTVIVSDDVPDKFTHHHHLNFQTGKKTSYVWRPNVSPSGPVSLIFSKKDKRFYILKNGILIGETPVQPSLFSEKISGTTAFVFSGWKISKNVAMSQWRRVGGAKWEKTNSLDEWFQMNPHFIHALQALITPSTTLVVTSKSVSESKGKDRHFSLIEEIKEENDD